jgi:hypothetical protein
MATPDRTASEDQARSPGVASTLPQPAAPRAGRRWLRFSLRTMLLVVTVLCVWLGVKVNQARRQKEAVAALEELGATIYYAHQRQEEDDLRFDAGRPPNVPNWLRELAGDHFFQRAVWLFFSRELADKDLVHLAALPHIEHLNLGRAGIGVTDAGLAHLPRPDRLSRFSASGTSVGDAFLMRLAGAKGLERLILANTRVTNAGLRALRGMSDLRFLSLSGTSVGDDGLEALQDLESLEHIVLAETQVTDAGLVHLARHNSLSVVELNHTAIGDAGMANLARTKSLWAVVLGNTRVSDAGLRHLAALPKLRALDLEGTEVRGPGLRHVAPLLDDWLILKYTAIDDAALAELKDAKRLQCLNLEQTAITDAGLVHLHGLPKLSLICLEATEVTAEGVAKLTKAIPGLGIVTTANWK